MLHQQDLLRLIFKTNFLMLLATKTAFILNSVDFTATQ